MAKNNNQNGASKNPAQDAKPKYQPDSISAWSWLFGNYAMILISLFLILPFGLYKAWGTGYEWLPIGSFVLIGAISIVAASKGYKQLVKSGDVRPFGE